MKQMRWAVVAWILAASTAWAATGVFHNGATTNATGSNISTADKGSMGIAVTISGTATVTFQGSADNGTTWANMNCVALGTTANVTSTVASGHYQCSVGGLTHVQTPISGCSGCTVTVRVNTSLASRGGGGGGSAIAVQEIDGAPTVGGVTGIKVTNGSLTDNGDGTVTIATSGAANLTIGVSTVTGGTAGSILTVGAGPLAQQVAITGLVKGNGTSQPTAAVAGTDYVAPAGNVATATALAANGANCAAGLAPLGVDASGAAETCTDYMEEPGSNGLVARTAANTAAARTITGTANQVDVTNGSGAAGNPTLALSSTLTIPGPGIEFTETAGDATCAAGNYWIKANSTTGNFRKCQNGTATDLDTGGGGSITGTVGTTNNALVRANGTGGSTAQGSLVTVDDTGKLTAPGGIEVTGGTGYFAMTEGTSPGAGASAGVHNLFITSSDSKLHSHENGGVDVTYTRTADNLSVFAATTSAELAGVLSDETGSSGGFVRATSPTVTTPTINTPTFGGTAPTLADGVTWTFNPNGTSAGLNIGSQAGAVGTPNNGDMWYDSTANKYKCRENGVTVDCISTGAGTGDVTDVVAGAGIAVATPGGPAPTVSLDMSTFVNNITVWDGANASRTMTINLSGTDPVWTYSSSTANLSTGTLQVGGSDVATAASTTTLTNKTLDAEGTGNTVTIPRRIWLPAAGCVNATAGSVWDLPATSPAVAACVTGTNIQKGVLDFADASDLSAQITYKLPSTWTGALDANVKWFSATTTGDVVWQVQTICVADAETDDPAFNTASTVTDTAKGTTNQTNDAAITGITTTGCAAGELMHVKIRRDAGHVSDTHAATARLIGVELVVREAM